MSPASCSSEHHVGKDQSERGLSQGWHTQRQTRRYNKLDRAQDCAQDCAKGLCPVIQSRPVSSPPYTSSSAHPPLCCCIPQVVHFCVQMPPLFCPCGTSSPLPIHLLYRSIPLAMHPSAIRCSGMAHFVNASMCHSATPPSPCHPIPRLRHPSISPFPFQPIPTSWAIGLSTGGGGGSWEKCSIDRTSNQLL